MDKLKVWYYDGIKVSKEKADEICETKYWEMPDWNHVELAYIQFKQQRIIMPFNVWHSSVEKTLGHSVSRDFFDSDIIKQQVIDKHQEIYFSKKTYYINITSITQGDDTDISMNDLRYACGAYKGINDAMAQNGFIFSVLDIVKGSACPGRLGGVDNFHTNWSVDFSSGVTVYYSVYIDDTDGKNMINKLRCVS